MIRFYDGCRGRGAEELQVDDPHPRSLPRLPQYAAYNCNYTTHHSNRTASEPTDFTSGKMSSTF